MAKNKKQLAVIMEIIVKIAVKHCPTDHPDWEILNGIIRAPEDDNDIKHLVLAVLINVALFAVINGNIQISTDNHWNKPTHYWSR